MQVHQLEHRDETRSDDYPTLFTIPLRPAWCDESEPLEPLIVRGMD